MVREGLTAPWAQCSGAGEERAENHTGAVRSAWMATKEPSQNEGVESWVRS